MNQDSEKIGQKYVSKVGLQITSIEQLEISPYLQILNLHCNKISAISGFDKTPFLQSLDLSGNQITKISGLGNLNHLRNLNLACNLITCIENLSNQRSLVNLNLSYNDIHSVAGLSVFSDKNYSLESLLLHGNQISGVEQFRSAIEGCQTLKTLTLSYDGVSNPVSLQEGYRERIAGLTQLEHVDGESKAGNTQIGIHNDYIDAIFSSDETYAEDTLSALTEDTDVPSYECPESTRNEPCRDFRDYQFSKSDRNLKESKTKGSRIPVAKTRNNNVHAQIQTDFKTEAESENLTSKETEDQIHDSNSDEKKRDILFGCYKALTNDLERERERRTDAEKCNSELSNVLNMLKSKLAKNSKQLAKQTSTNAELRTYLDQQDKNYKEIEGKYCEEQVKVKKNSIKIEELTTSLSKYKEAAASLEQSLMIKEAEIARENANYIKVENEKQIDVKASRREVDLVTSNNEKLKKQVSALQKVIANREHEFQKQKEGLFSTDSNDFKRMVETEVCSIKALHSRNMVEKDERIKELSTLCLRQKEEYRRSVEEESQQLCELQKAFETKCFEIAEMEKNMEEFKSKEDQSISLISEMSNVVREQQKRNLVSTNQTHRLNEDLKRTSKDYEDLLSKHKIQLTQNDEIKKGKTALEKKLKGLEAVMEGLRTEKSLWSKELVNQGAMLSQNRGRIELKLETLEKDLKNRKNQEEKLNDTIKIKSKMLEDQTETVKKLKVGIVERDSEIKKLTSQIISTSRESDSLSNELETCKVSFDKLADRKDALKLENRDLKEELTDFTDAYNEINDKWIERVHQIEELERQLSSAYNLWNEKEKKLRNERDRAVAAAELAIKKLQDTENSCFEKCELKKQETEELLKCVENAKILEINKIKQKNLALHQEIIELVGNYNSTKEDLRNKLEKLDSFL